MNNKHVKEREAAVYVGRRIGDTGYLVSLSAPVPYETSKDGWTTGGRQTR